MRTEHEILEELEAAERNHLREQCCNNSYGISGGYGAALDKISKLKKELKEVRAKQ